MRALENHNKEIWGYSFFAVYTLALWLVVSVNDTDLLLKNMPALAASVIWCVALIIWVTVKWRKASAAWEVLMVVMLLSSLKYISFNIFYAAPSIVLLYAVIRNGFLLLKARR